RANVGRSRQAGVGVTERLVGDDEIETTIGADVDRGEGLVVQGVGEGQGDEGISIVGVVAGIRGAGHDGGDGGSVHVIGQATTAGRSSGGGASAGTSAGGGGCAGWRTWRRRRPLHERADATPLVLPSRRGRPR